MQTIVEGIIEFVPRVTGWAVLKLLTLGRYRGFGSDDLLLEGGVGIATIALLIAAWYFWR